MNGAFRLRLNAPYVGQPSPSAMTARDQIKDEALARVGLPLLRLAHDTTPEVRDAAIAQALADAAAAAVAA